MQVLMRNALRSRAAGRPAAAAIANTTITNNTLFSRPMHTTAPSLRESASAEPVPNDSVHGEPVTDDLGAMPDTLGNSRVKGRTGGGDALSSSSNAPPKPKISNLSVPGSDDASKEMSAEQKREVEEHNKDFDRKHDRSPPAPEDKVDKRFWREDQEGRKP